MKKVTLQSMMLIVSLNSTTYSEAANHEQATNLIVCAVIYQLAESMLLNMGTGVTSEPTFAKLLHEKQKSLIEKAIQESDVNFVQDVRQKAIDKLLDKTIEEYSLLNDKSIGYQEFLLNKYDRNCSTLIN